MALIKTFEYISFEQLSVMSLESEYLMNLSLKPQMVQDKYGIEFSKPDALAEEYFAAIKAPDANLIFEFRAGRTNSVSVHARGKNIDIREAYSVFNSLLKLHSSEIQWISDSV